MEVTRRWRSRLSVRPKKLDLDPAGSIIEKPVRQSKLSKYLSLRRESRERLPNSAESDATTLRDSDYGMSTLELTDSSTAEIEASDLWTAACWGPIETVKLLLDRGVDVNAEDGDYGHPLFAATYIGRKDVVMLLLVHGANVNAPSEHGTALEAAAFTGHQDIVELLLSCGADVNAPGSFGNALQAAAFYGRKEIVEILLFKGADLEAPGIYGTALQAATIPGHTDVVELLLSKGANVNARSKAGTPLQSASYHGHTAIVNMLLARSADVNAGGVYGTPLQQAAMAGHRHIVELLLAHGADVSARGGLFGTALEAAKEGGHRDIVSLVWLKAAKVKGVTGWADYSPKIIDDTQTLGDADEPVADISESGSVHSADDELPADDKPSVTDDSSAKDDKPTANEMPPVTHDKILPCEDQPPQDANGPQSHASSPSDGAKPTKATSGRAKKQTGGRKKRKPNPSDNDDGDEDQDADDQPSREQDGKPGSASLSHPLACPFFKNDPERWSGCRKQELANIARVNHHSILRCTRCKMSFPIKSTKVSTCPELEEHCQGTCEYRASPLSIDGVACDNWVMIGVRDRLNQDKTAEIVWRNIYTAIFGNHQPPPSPHYELVDRSTAILQYQAYLMSVAPEMLARGSGMSQEEILAACFRDFISGQPSGPAPIQTVMPPTCSHGDSPVEQDQGLSYNTPDSLGTDYLSQVGPTPAHTMSHPISSVSQPVMAASVPWQTFHPTYHRPDEVSHDPTYDGMSSHNGTAQVEVFSMNDFSSTSSDTSYPSDVMSMMDPTYSQRCPPGGVPLHLEMNNREASRHIM